MTLSVMTLSNMTFNASAKYCYAECHLCCVTIKSIILSIIMMSDVMLSVVMLNVVAPSCHFVNLLKLFIFYFLFWFLKVGKTIIYIGG